MGRLRNKLKRKQSIDCTEVIWPNWRNKEYGKFKKFVQIIGNSAEKRLRPQEEEMMMMTTRMRTQTREETKIWLKLTRFMRITCTLKHLLCKQWYNVSIRK